MQKYNDPLNVPDPDHTPANLDAWNSGKPVNAQVASRELYNSQALSEAAAKRCKAGGEKHRHVLTELATSVLSESGQPTELRTKAEWLNFIRLRVVDILRKDKPKDDRLSNQGSSVGVKIWENGKPITLSRTVRRFNLNKGEYEEYVEQVQTVVRVANKKPRVDEIAKAPNDLFLTIRSSAELTAMFNEFRDALAKTDPQGLRLIDLIEQRAMRVDMASTLGIDVGTVATRIEKLLFKLSTFMPLEEIIKLS